MSQFSILIFWANGTSDQASYSLEFLSKIETRMQFLGIQQNNLRHPMLKGSYFTYCIGCNFL
jgi:hypothetical protein